MSQIKIRINILMQNACTFIVIELPKTVAKVTIEEALVGHDNYILTMKL